MNDPKTGGHSEMEQKNRNRRQLSALFDLVRRVDEEFTNAAEHGEATDEQFLAHQIRVAYNAALALADERGLRSLASMLRESFSRFQNNLLEAELIHAVGEPHLRTISPITEVALALQMLDGAAESSAFDPSFELAVRLLRGIAKSSHLIDYQFTKEADLDKFCESQLVSLFPDLNSNPSLDIGISYRQPDSAIPSIGTLIEYKFLKEKKQVSGIIDEIQADVRNYAGKGFDRLIIVVGQTGWHVREESLAIAVKREPTSFSNIETIVDVLFSPRTSASVVDASTTPNS